MKTLALPDAILNDKNAYRNMKVSMVLSWKKEVFVI